MNCAEVSDLEEGEILEYDSVSSNYSRGDFGARNWCSESSLKENRNGHFEFKANKELCLPERRKDGYINLKLKEKLNLNEVPREEKSNIIMADLESISSEGECKSDEEDKYPASESEYYACANEDTKKREKHSPHFYGTVEDIMSEIGETICRKSRCNYKKRKSKEVKQNLDKCSSSAYGLWRREIFSSHLKSKKHKRKGSFCDSDSDLGKHRTEKRKKRKKREVYYEEEETPAKKLKLRDFDEVRRNLLEKLKKQKAEEEPKESPGEAPLETENSEIQEIDMLIDCTNYVDNPPDATPEGSANGGGGGGGEAAVEENEGEDELDLIKLRSIALASNKKRKVGEAATNAARSPDLSAEKSKEEVDLDRNELLLRAEALKTALLKKHQRRLNRLKVDKPGETGSSSITDGENSSPLTEETLKCADLEKENAALDADTCKENVESGAADRSDVLAPSHLELEKDKGSGPFASNGNSKKAHSRAKTKRKKRKSVSFGNNLKENNEKSEALEEDDRTLRTQLLSDLMKKKSLKDMEKKSVLMDSIQTAANKPSPSLPNTAEPPKEIVKPPPALKKNLLKKVNAPKTVKPVVVAKFPKPEIQRIIVHLGSEDSSDEDSAAVAASGPQAPPQEKEVEGKGSAMTEPSDANKEAGEVIQAKYERSVELLLSQARKKIEGEKRIATKTLATPEAVYKHLPPSQRLEYIRLKQKIAEREKLRKRQMENASNSVSASSAPQPVQTSAANGEESLKKVSQKPTSGNVAKTNSSPDSSSQITTSNTKACKDQMVRNSSSDSKNVGGATAINGTKSKETSQRLVVNKMKNTLTGFSGNNSNAGSAPLEKEMKTAAPTERSFLLLPSSRALITKLKLLLKKIKIEKMIEENYEKEISKLKNQLNLFEKKKCEQRFKIKKIWEESMKTYKAIQGITGRAKEKVPKGGEREEEKKAETDGRAATDEGKKPEKGDTKETKEAVEEEGKKVSDEPETEINASERGKCPITDRAVFKMSQTPHFMLQILKTTQSKSDKELKNDDKISESTAEEGAPVGPCQMKYDSPLQVFTKVSDRSTRVDPNVMVCQFDLMGVCKDEECTYQHLRIAAK